MMKWLKIVGGVVVVIGFVVGAGIVSFQNAVNGLERPPLADCKATSDAACDGTFKGASGVIEYRLLKPENNSVPQAMLVMLHGSGISGPTQEWLSNGRLQDLATNEKILVLLPSAGGEYNGWQDEENPNHPIAQKMQDQLPALLKLIDTMASDYNFDRRNVALSGYSNGGTMSMRMACEAETPFIAVGTYGSPTTTVQINKGCAHPTPVLLNHGAKDGTNKFEGGYASFLWREVREYEGYPLEPVLSAAQTVDFWRNTNGCTDEAKTTMLPDGDPHDGTLTQLISYTNCTSDMPVLQAVVENGSHTIPGARPFPFVVDLVMSGKHSMDYSGHDVFWSFAKDFLHQ
ncbi:MAG: alpha/beta hydrolase-fold protein [Pseudomonadota bacterium]